MKTHRFIVYFQATEEVDLWLILLYIENGDLRPSMM